MRKFKTRSLAAEAVKKEQVWINRAPVKPAREAKVNDEISLKREGITYRYKVLAFPKARVGAKLVEQYVTETTEQSELDKKDFIGLMKKMNRKKGTGRPTKKERRDLDDLIG